MLDSRTHDGAVWKGVAAGVAGGLVASYVMNQFQAVTKKLSAGEGNGGGQGEAAKNEGEDATVKTAEAITGAFGHPISQDEKKVAGPVVHYAFGATMGAVYGALAELSPTVAKGAGVPFGTAVWLGADEIAVPALHLSKKPAESPPSVHASALASHVVYGLTTDLVRRAVLRVL
jgi:putative membrane protein